MCSISIMKERETIMKKIVTIAALAAAIATPAAADVRDIINNTSSTVHFFEDGQLIFNFGRSHNNGRGVDVAVVEAVGGEEAWVQGGHGYLVANNVRLDASAATVHELTSYVGSDQYTTVESSVTVSYGDEITLGNGYTYRATRPEGEVVEGSVQGCHHDLYWRCSEGATWQEVVETRVFNDEYRDVEVANFSWYPRWGTDAQHEQGAREINAWVENTDALIVHAGGNEGVGGFYTADHKRGSGHYYSKYDIDMSKIIIVGAVTERSQHEATRKPCHALTEAEQAADWACSNGRNQWAGRTFGTGNLASYSVAAGEEFKNDFIVALDTRRDGLSVAEAGHGGTSSAAPKVAAAAALVKAKFGTNAVNTKKILLQTADDLGERGVDAVFGHGRLNVIKALNAPRYLVAGDQARTVFGSRY